MSVPDHLGLALMVAGLLICLVLVALGAARVAGRVSSLKRRIDAYGELPLFAVVEAADARLLAARRRAAGLPALRLRAAAAVAQIVAARKRVGMIAQSARHVVRNMLSAG